MYLVLPLVDMSITPCCQPMTRKIYMRRFERQSNRLRRQRWKRFVMLKAITDWPHTYTVYNDSPVMCCALAYLILLSVKKQFLSSKQGICWLRPYEDLAVWASIWPRGQRLRRTHSNVAGEQSSPGRYCCHPHVCLEASNDEARTCSVVVSRVIGSQTKLPAS